MASEEEIEENSLDLWNKIDNNSYSDSFAKEIIKLIDSGNIDFNFSNIQSQERTILHVASSKRSTNIVEKLLDKGAEIDREDLFGNTPLFYAVKAGHLNVVELLLNRGANINKIDKIGYTSLYYAVDFKNLDMVELLLKYGAKISFKPNPSITPIHYIAIHKNGDVGVKLLNVFIKYSVNINEQDIYNDTPLHIATMTNNYKIAETLIKNGASFDIKNNDGKTALDIAKEEKYTEIEKLMDEAKKSQEAADVRRIEDDINYAMGIVKKPDTNVKKPDTNVKKPDTNVKKPDTNVKTHDTNVKTPDTNVSEDVDIDKLLEELGKLDGGKRTQKRKSRQQKTRRKRNKKSRKKRR